MLIENDTLTEKDQEAICELIAKQSTISGIKMKHIIHLDNFDGFYYVEVEYPGGQQLWLIHKVVKYRIERLSFWLGD